MGRSEYDYSSPRPEWNAGRKVGAKRPLKPRQIWAIRFHLDREHRLRDRALFDLAIDGKLRGCDLLKIKIGDLVAGGEMRTRAIVNQQKTGRPGSGYLGGGDAKAIELGRDDDLASQARHRPLCKPAFEHHRFVVPRRADPREPFGGDEYAAGGAAAAASAFADDARDVMVACRDHERFAVLGLDFGAEMVGENDPGHEEAMSCRR